MSDDIFDYCDSCGGPMQNQDDEIERLRNRLELYAINEDGSKRILLDDTSDGIACRNETIREQDQTIDRLRRELAEARERVSSLEGALDMALNTSGDHSPNCTCRLCGLLDWQRRAVPELQYMNDCVCGGAAWHDSLRALISEAQK